jgi:hypothetical protein
MSSVNDGERRYFIIIYEDESHLMRNNLLLDGVSS